MNTTPLTAQALDVILREARTFSYWQNKPVADSVLKELYELVKFGPTSANCLPLRIVFLTSKEAKERLKPALMEGNVEKTMSAPVTAILAYDRAFYNQLPKLFPHTDAKAWFTGNEAFAKQTATVNSSVQAGYFILAARALGLDCGPMTGFSTEAVDKEFFAEENWASLILCNLGYGDRARLHPRNPRLSFDEACKVL